MSRKKGKRSMKETPSAPAPEVKVEKPSKPQRQPVSDEEALNISFNEFNAIIDKHGGDVEVAHIRDAKGRMIVYLSGVERVEPPGSATVTLRFKAHTTVPTAPTPMRLPQLPK